MIKTFHNVIVTKNTAAINKYLRPAANLGKHLDFDLIIPMPDIYRRMSKELFLQSYGEFNELSAQAKAEYGFSSTPEWCDHHWQNNGSTQYYQKGDRHYFQTQQRPKKIVVELMDIESLDAKWYWTNNIDTENIGCYTFKGGPLMERSNLGNTAQGLRIAYAILGTWPHILKPDPLVL